VPYAFNLTLDPQCSDDMERLYASLSALDIPDHELVTQYGPCVTILIVGDRVSPETVGRTLELRLPTIAAVALTFTEPCIILGTPPTLSLRVDPTGSLLALHAALYCEFPEDEVHLHYRPAYWQPHLKLANVRNDHAGAAKLVAAVAADWRTTLGTGDRLEVIRYPPTQSIWQAPLRI
jgi:hypothetical protein